MVDLSKSTNVFPLLADTRTLVFLYLSALLFLTGCGVESSARPIRDEPAGEGDTVTVTPNVASDATASPSAELELHPSSYIDCEGLAVHDSIFLQEISTDPIVLHYYGLELIEDRPISMTCKGMAVFQTRRTAGGEPPHERYLTGRLVKQENIGKYFDSRQRRGYGAIYEHIVQIQDVYIVIQSYTMSSDSD